MIRDPEAQLLEAPEIEETTGAPGVARARRGPPSSGRWTRRCRPADGLPRDHAACQQDEAGDVTSPLFGLAAVFAFPTLLDMPIDLLAQIGLPVLARLSAEYATRVVAFAEDARHEGREPRRGHGPCRRCACGPCR